MKIPRSKLPDNHTFGDLTYNGKFAIKDDEFNDSRACFMGSFEQETKNSNKFYFCCVCQSKLNSKWFCYSEWGRTGSKADFQFEDFDTENEAFTNYQKQCKSKNIKRGIWKEHNILGKILVPKPKQDLYLVRNMSTINCNIPDVTRICTKPNKIISSKISSQFDPETEKLLADLKAGTVSYAKNSFASGSIPDILAINEARKILSIAAKAPKKELDELTKILYSKIPKRTYVGEVVELSSDNIKNWLDDLDAFESALNSVESPSVEISTKYMLSHVDKNQTLWYNINRLVESSTRNRHSYLSSRKLQILNMWEVTNIPDAFARKQEEISKEFTNTYFPLIFQPLRTETESKCNCQLLIHGSRTCNIGSILSTGFRLPKELSGVAINGANLGAGSYHSCDWRKSAGYCSIKGGYFSNGSGAINNRAAFIFLNDVILGNPYIVSRPQGFAKPPSGYHSVIADTKGSFQNEEFVVYDTSMFFPRYLLEFTV